MLWLIPMILGGGLLLSQQKNVKQRAQEYFGPFIPIGPQPRDRIDQQAMHIAREKLIVSEGRRNDVYRDHLGYLTVGIGHKVLPRDNLKLGDRISDARIEELFAQDIKIAFDAARSQAMDLQKYDPHFIAALTEVNFQLGTGWVSKFPRTYALLKTGNAKAAINNLRTSLWNQQTPVRVAHFITAIEQAYYGGLA